MTTPRNRRPLDRVGQRAAGRRRIAGATALSATGGAALALAFGVVFAQGSAAADAGKTPTGIAPAAAILPAKPAAQQPTGEWPSHTESAPTTVKKAPAKAAPKTADKPAPVVETTTEAPQPPVEAPKAADTSHSDASSGGS
jgi:hypothetical protein